YDGDFVAEEGVRRDWPQETMRKNADMTGAQREGFEKALAAGVRMAYGTDSGVYPHGWNAKQLPYMVRFGMTPIEAIRSATVTASWGVRGSPWGMPVSYSSSVTSSRVPSTSRMSLSAASHAATCSSSSLDASAVVAITSIASRCPWRRSSCISRAYSALASAS